MAKTGRPSLPREVKEAQGTLNKTRERRIDERARAATVGVTFVPVPPCPADWSAQEQAAWAELKTQLDIVGTYAESDYSAFQVLVRLYASFHDAAEEHEPTTMAALATKISAFMTRFGLDPASRTRVPSATRQAEAQKADEDKFGDGPPELKVVS